MSSTLDTYAVSLEGLRRACGSRDRGLIEAIAAGQSYLLEQADGLRDDAELTCRQALAQIIDGDDLGDVPSYLGYLYGYALEAICAQIGEPLENIPGIVGASAWGDAIDRFLQQVGVPLRFSDVMFGRIPVEIPEPDDYPFIGSWPPEVIARALGPLGAADLSGADPEHAETVRVVRGWVEAAARRPGCGIVGFLA